jgi:hypothetical protein
MTLKTSVGGSLILALLLAGSILLFGLVNSFFLPTYYFFSLFILSILIYSARASFSSKKDLAFALVTALVLAGFLAYSASGAKMYFERQGSLTPDNLAQINALIKNNDNNLVYANYLTEQINLIQTNSVKLQAQIDSLLSKSANPIQNNTPQTIIPPINLSRERERENDD